VPGNGYPYRNPRSHAERGRQPRRDAEAWRRSPSTNAKCDSAVSWLLPQFVSGTVPVPSRARCSGSSCSATSAPPKLCPAPTRDATWAHWHRPSAPLFGTRGQAAARQHQSNKARRPRFEDRAASQVHATPPQRSESPRRPQWRMNARHCRHRTSRCLLLIPDGPPDGQLR
jgi:hypothetical protein